MSSQLAHSRAGMKRMAVAESFGLGVRCTDSVLQSDLRCTALASLTGLAASVRELPVACGSPERTLADQSASPLSADKWIFSRAVRGMAGRGTIAPFARRTRTPHTTFPNTPGA